MFRKKPATLLSHDARVGVKWTRKALVSCLINTVMKMRGHFCRRQGAMTSSGVHHARKSNAADGEKDPQIHNGIYETGH